MAAANAPAFDFRGYRVLVAGGSRGIGRSMALGFAEAGAAVSICARGAAALEETRLQLAAHDVVKAEAKAELGGRQMATTLSLAIVVWPWLYVLQVGDSRCYFYQNGALQQVTRDQTIGQNLVDEGVLKKEQLRASPLNHVLASAIGASEAMPEVSRVDVRQRGSVILVCTDGLTKHVPDAEIATYLGAMTSSEQVCHDLLSLALDRGGSDNITLVVGRALPVAKVAR